MKIVENCFTCTNCLSKNYMTIRCSIWTEKIRNWLISNESTCDPEHLIGRIHHEIKCQYYKIKKNNQKENNMDKRPNLDEYFMILAKIASIRSTCNSRHNGCVIVKDNQILSTGYNGALPGCKHCSDYYTHNDTEPNLPFCERRNKNISHVNKENFCVAAHAEANAVAQAAKKGILIDGSMAYCTLFPCYNCLKTMTIAGVKKIFYEYEYGSNNDIRDKYWKNQVLNAGIKLEKLTVSQGIIDIVIDSLQFPTAKRRLDATE